jgi:hypothetical protein
MSSNLVDRAGFGLSTYALLGMGHGGVSLTKLRLRLRASKHLAFVLLCTEEDALG